MRAGANATSAAIISYSPAADVGKRVGLVWIPPHPYAGTSFDTGHLPAGRPTHPHHHPSAFRWQGKDAFKDNVWGNWSDAPLAVTAVCSFQPSADTTHTPKLALEMLTSCTGCCCETVCVLIWVPKDDPLRLYENCSRKRSDKKKSLLQNINMLELPQHHLGVMADMI